MSNIDITVITWDASQRCDWHRELLVVLLACPAVPHSVGISTATDSDAVCDRDRARRNVVGLSI